MPKIFNLTEGSIIKKLFLVALPVLMTSLAQMAYNLADMFWIGHVDNIGLIESEAISAVGTAGMVAWFSFGIILIAKIGTSVRVSHAAGNNDGSGISKYASNGLLLQIIFGVLFTIVTLLFKKQMLSVFNIQNEHVTAYALTYLSILSIGFTFQFLSNGFLSINEGLGKTKTNFFILLIGVSLNIVLDPLFILVFRMDVAGAALATIISQGVSLLGFIIYYYLKNQSVHAFSFKSFDLDAMKKIISVGLPAGLQSLLFTTISIVITRFIYQFGDQVVTAQRIGVQIEQFTWMIAGGFQTALTVYVGQNFGANQYERIRKGVLTLSAILIPYSILVSLMLYFIPGSIMKIFVDDPVVIEKGARYLLIISLAQIFMMMESIGTGLFNGLGKTLLPSISGIINNLVRIPIALYLMKSIQEDGIWWSLNISDILKGTILLVGSIYLLKNIEKVLSRSKIKSQLKEVRDVTVV